MLLGAPAAFAGALTPESGGSPNADDINTLYKITLYIALVIFVGVEGALIWALVRFRRKRASKPAAQIRGNTPLELGWTLGAAVILVVLGAVTFLYLDGSKTRRRRARAGSSRSPTAPSTPRSTSPRPLADAS